MSSEAQSFANRANARQSTGPRTEQGKSRIAQNATRHGLFSTRMILPGEDPHEFESLHDGFYARFKPADAVECVYVDRMILAAWRMARLQRAESEHAETRSRANPFRSDDFGAGALLCDVKRFEQYGRYQTTLERQMDRSLNELRKLQKERRESADEELPVAPRVTRAPVVERRDTPDPVAQKVPIAQSNPIPAPAVKSQEPPKENTREFKPNSSSKQEPKSLNPIISAAVAKAMENFEFKPNFVPASEPNPERAMKTA